MTLTNVIYICMCVLYGISVYNKRKAVSKMYLTVRKGFTALDVSA